MGNWNPRVVRFFCSLSFPFRAACKQSESFGKGFLEPSLQLINLSINNCYLKQFFKLWCEHQWLKTVKRPRGKRTAWKLLPGPGLPLQTCGSPAHSPGCTGWAGRWWWWLGCSQTLWQLTPGCRPAGWQPTVGGCSGTTSGAQSMWRGQSSAGQEMQLEGRRAHFQWNSRRSGVVGAGGTTGVT